MVEQNQIGVPINQFDGSPHSYPSNKEYAIALITNCILNLFPNLNKVQVETLALQMFNNVETWKDFKATIRDLMVAMRSFSSQENAFYEHEMKVSS